MKEKPRLVHTQTQNGWFCEYFGEINGIRGIGGFGRTPFAAEQNMWYLVKKQCELVYSKEPKQIIAGRDRLSSELYIFAGDCTKCGKHTRPINNQNLCERCHKLKEPYATPY